MRRRAIFIILAASLLFNPVLGYTKYFSSISFSSELSLGDVYSWQINNSSTGLHFETDDVVYVEIIGEPRINIKGDNTLVNLTSIFNITINNNQIPNKNWDEYIFLFICPNEAVYTNGTRVNPADNLWIGFAFESFYNIEGMHSESTNGNLVTYSEVQEFNTGETEYFDGVVDRKTGIVQSLEFSLVDSEGVVLEIINLNFLNKEEKLTQAFIPFNTLPIVFYMVILSIIIRKRKITN